LAGLIVEDAKNGITAGPFGEEIDGALQICRGLIGVAMQSGDDAESPENFPRAGDALEAFGKSGFGSGEIVGAKFGEG